MSFHTGVITDAANPTAALQAEINTVLTAHPAWELAYEGTPEATTGHTVWRSLGTVNSLGADFFVNFYRSSITMMRVFAAGIFDPDAGTFTDYCFYPGTASITPDALGRPGTLPTATLAQVQGSNAQNAAYLTGNATSFSWWLSVTADRVVGAATAGTTNTAVYAGLYERTYSSTVDAVPLITCSLQPNLTSDNTSQASFPREISPGATPYFANAYLASENQLGPHSVNSTKDAALDAFVATRILVGSPRAARANMRGSLFDMRWAMNGVNGDTATIDGEIYTAVNNQSSGWYYWVRNAA